MTISRDYYDDVMKLEVREFNYKGKHWRFPKLLGDRFEVTEMVTVSGFGALLIAQDRWIFGRKVLVKTGFLKESDLCAPNNAAIPDLVKDVNKGYERERNLLLHGQMRQIGGIPVLIEWLRCPSPMIRGPHKAMDGREFYHDNPECWQNMVYLVLSYFEGKQLDEYCQNKPHQIISKPDEYFTFLASYLTRILTRFHESLPVGKNKIHFIYQDLKPANILVSTIEKRYCLIDFGGVATCPAVGIPLNPGVYTDEFAPPEAKAVPFLPEQAVRPTWDIYTLGTTLRKCMQLAGVESTCSLTFKNFIDRCTENKRENRFQNMREVTTALKSV